MPSPVARPGDSMNEEERSFRKSVIVFAILEALFLLPLVILLILSR